MALFEKVEFLDDLHLVRFRDGPGGVVFIVERDYSIAFDQPAARCRWRYTVPAGMQTDFASVPQALQSIVSPIGSYVEASVVHDSCYEHQSMRRDEADALFHAVMLASGVEAETADMIYAAVRVGGRAFWNNHKPDPAIVPKIVTHY